ncbi:MAG: PEP/pyruvate-binding domain-containing protein [Planctomycetota bacterium]
MSETWIRTSDGSAPDRELGGKAAALRALGLHGLPIPAWFAIAPGAWNASQGSASDEAVRADPLLAQAWIAAAQRIAGHDGLLAVRSSASDEDGGEHSFAGQLDSYLAVRPEDVPAKVSAVWRSAFSERILAYRSSRQLGAPRPPAVLVQRLVIADTAGVAFSADPVSGRWSVAIVSAVVGLGTRLVGGAGDADTWRVDRTGAIIERTIVAKSHAHRPQPGEGEGVTDVPVNDPNAPALNDAQVRAVADLARRCAQARTRPQDIEWAWHRGELFLLQSRPITTLADRPDPDGRPALWDNSNIAESYGGVTTPLTYSFARRAYEEVYRQFCRLMGVPGTRIQANADTFRAMIGCVRGRVYYDLLNWYRVLALLPGFQANRGFMEQMMGVKEGLPPELAGEFAPPGRWERFCDTLRLVVSMTGLVRNHLTMDRQIRIFYERLVEALADPAVPFEQQRPDELVASYRILERRLLTRWDAPLTNDFFAMIFYGALRQLCVRWCDDRDGTLQNDLVGGEGGVVSAEPALRVKAMARLVTNDQPFANALRTASLAEVLTAARSRPAFWQEFQGYLARFGDRCLEELKLESATLHDDPLPVLRAVGHFAARAVQEPTDYAAAARRTAEERVRKQLRWRPIRRLVFGWVLRNARARVRNRENLRFERTRLFGRVRHILVELGSRMAAVSVLESPRDVFWLELEEVLGFVSGTTSCHDLKALAHARRTAYERYSNEPAPADRFLTRGWVGATNPFTAAPAKAGVDPTPVSDRRTGTGCCPGVVRGHARVVRDPRGVELPTGTILVAERTDPGWIMLFPAAAGLVVERGSLLSHSAIVARELGLPAVVGVPGCTAWIVDGDLIELDGATGVVRKVSEP